LGIEGADGSKVFSFKDIFKKVKILGHDGWTVDCFWVFMISKRMTFLGLLRNKNYKEKFLGAMNANFIALIPKKNNMTTFEDLMSIYLCNIVYKIVSKIIANRLKQSLSNMVTKA
jgi:hypothetical protein